MASQPTSSPRRGLATAAIVLGFAALAVTLVTLALFLVPGIGMGLLGTTIIGAGLAGVLGGAGVIVGIVALFGSGPKTRAAVGVAASALAIVLAIVAYVSVFGITANL